MAFRSSRPSFTDIRGLSPDQAVLRIPEITQPPEHVWTAVAHQWDWKLKPKSELAQSFRDHYLRIGIAEHEMDAVLAALQECQRVFRSIRREWHWSFLIAKHLWAAECERAGGYIPKSELPQDPTHFIPAIVMFRDGLDALGYGLEMLVLESLFHEFQFKWHIIRVPAGHNPLCLWADYFARPEAEWVEFAEIPEGPAYSNHRLIANIAYRLCEENATGDCQLPVHNLAAIIFGCDIPSTAKRITRIRQFLIVWGVLIETEPAEFTKHLATTFRVRDVPQVTQAIQAIEG
jgi:hypothetical protein